MIYVHSLLFVIFPYLQLRAIVVFDNRYNARENKLLWNYIENKSKKNKKIYASCDGGARR